MSTKAAVSIILIIIVALGLSFYLFTNDGGVEKFVAMEGEGLVPKPTQDNVDESLPQANDGETSTDSLIYSGEVLAGGKAVLLDFKQADYEAAIMSDKLVVLYFYANWCPICREEVPKLYAAFDQLTADKVIGFRVNYNDNQTDDFETDLASEFGVAYQHTKVFIKNGSRVLKSPETWDTQRYLEEINRASK